MGTLQLAFVVLAMSAPIGNVNGVLPLGITRGNGIGTPTIYFAIGMVFLLFAVGFTTMTRHMSKTGGFYTYITAGLGRPLGLGAGAIAAFAYLVYLVGSYAYLGVSVNQLMRSLDLYSPPWWVWGAVAGLIITVLGHFNVDLSGRVLAAFMIGEVIIVMLFNLPVLFTGGPQGYQFDSFTPSEVFTGDLGVAALFALNCFIGFESTAIYREECRRPEKTVPRATYLAIAVLTLFYTVTSWALITYWGVGNVRDAGKDDPTVLFTDGFKHYMGSTITQIMIVLVVTSVFAGTLATHNALSRYFFALGRDGIVPKFLGRPNSKHGSPANASMTSSVLALVGNLLFIALGVTAVNMYSSMFALGAFSILLLFALTTIAVYFYFRRNRRHERRWNTAVAPALALLGLIVLIGLSSAYYAMSIGGPVWLAVVQQIALVAIVVGGVVLALRWRRTRPAVYAAIGEEIADDPLEPASEAARH